MMAITIKDVAKKAGVAPSTVSRVVADSSSISNKTKVKVRKVMQELNYFPNANAQGLASSRSKTFGLVLPLASDAFYQNPFFPTVLRGINYSMAKNDYSILLSSGQTDEQRLNHIQKIVYGKQVEGLIFLYAAQDDPLLNFAQQAGCPSVVIGSPNNSKVHLVDNDNEKLGEIATTHLIENGCETIAYIGGDMNQFFISDRLNGYKQALKNNGLSYNEEYIYNDLVFLPLDGYHLALETLDLEQYDGLVIADELVAEGIQKALMEKNMQQIQTVSFKAFEQQLDIPTANESYINLNSHLLGSRAVDILFDSLADSARTKERYIHEYVDAKLIHAPK
jgi:LacI family transcriptional regulator